MSSPFPTTPSITLFDPLAQFLGAGDGEFHYTFDDVVRLSGHACPTVAGAFLMVIHAMDALYGEEMPVRGGVQVSLSGAVDQGVNGPISQVFTLLTGATDENGFHGLAGQFARDHLMEFHSAADGVFAFTRTDNGQSVQVRYDASSIMPNPEMAVLMKQALQPGCDTTVRQQFSDLWRDRVIRILQDGGQETVTVQAV